MDDHQVFFVMRIIATTSQASGTNITLQQRERLRVLAVTQRFFLVCNVLICEVCVSSGDRPEPGRGRAAR